MSESEPTPIPADLLALMEELFHREAIEPWFDQPNPAFDGATPRDILARGESWKIRRMIEIVASGAHL